MRKNATLCVYFGAKIFVTQIDNTLSTLTSTQLIKLKISQGHAAAKKCQTKICECSI